MGVKFRIDNRFGNRHVAANRSSADLDWFGRPTARNAGSVVAACISTNDIGRASIPEGSDKTSRAVEASVPSI
jgi:hypothetical protein